MLVDGKMIKVDAKQFECDIKRKTLEKMKELSDCDSKFKPAFEELQKAIEFYGRKNICNSICFITKSSAAIFLLHFFVGLNLCKRTYITII